ncbi:MAG: hypothetical protein IPJ01_10650 [Micavibrio sp.]|nr:hypothetical protein [Micavibrio sp.]
MNKETKYFLSKEFKDNCSEQVKKDTWDKGLPMIYMDDEGRIVEHWENGKIKIIKKSKSSKNAISKRANKKKH